MATSSDAGFELIIPVFGHLSGPMCNKVSSNPKIYRIKTRKYETYIFSSSWELMLMAPKT
jgi:hypothetical protein